MQLLIVAIAMLAGLIVPTGAARAQDKKLEVVATFTIIADLARQVGGERISLRTLVGPNGDAHVYQAKPSDAVAVAAADVVLANGLSFDSFIVRLLEASGSTARLVELTDGVPAIEDPDGGHVHYVDDEAVFHPAPVDPHAWQSVANAKIYVANIARAFCSADAGGCNIYEANASAYIAELTSLDAEVHATLEGLSANGGTAVVAHNAFRYFEQAYGVRFQATHGLSTGAEASAARIAHIIRDIRQNSAIAVFSENIADTRLVQQIAAEAGVALSGVLYSDALSHPGECVATYIDLIRHNARTIANGLGPD